MHTRRLMMLGVLLAVGIIAGAVSGNFFSADRPSPDTNAPSVPTPDPMIVVDAPVPGAQITSPLQVTGRARGNWYFEASFPVILKGPGGVVLATVPAQAQGDWMTTDWVPFTATLVFTLPAPGSSGVLILQKDNPSGEPQFDDSRNIPVVF